MAERMGSGEFDPENDCCQNVVINPEQLDMLIVDIDRFFSWCSGNIPETCKAFRNFGSSEEDIRQAIAKSADCTIGTYDGDWSGDPDFLFCAIKSMQDLLKYAKDNNTPIAYKNLVEC